MRAALASAAALLVGACGLAAAQEPPAAAPATTTAPAPPVPGAAVVDRRGTRMTVRVEYRVPPGMVGVVPTRWRSFAGPRSARHLAAIGHGLRQVAVADGVYRFTAHARMGSGTDRSGGFCVAPDFPAVGLAPVEARCIDAPRAHRGALTATVPEVTVFGDSVGAAFDWVPGTREAAARGLSVRYDLRTCRRLVAAPCPPGPPSVLSSVRSMPGSLGDVAVINVGYNDWAGTYDVPRVVRALRARGVRRVVWVTLRGTQASYRQINAEIRAAARRSPRIQVADWDRASRSRPWFAADRVHLNSAGGWGLAVFIRAEQRKAVNWLRARPGY